MNAVEIEQAITDLSEQPFDGANFPFAFLEAFGNKETTVKKLRNGASNKSDLGGVLQPNHIHIKVADTGTTAAALTALRGSPATQNKRHKVRYILATDGVEFEAEDLTTGETVACTYADFPNHFGFFLPLAGITTVKQIRENAFDVRATSRLNRLYVTLLQENPDWGTATRRHDMNHFMARLIFCFFAEDTDIFHGDDLFTATIAQMSDRDSSNTHEVISEIFRAMNTAINDRVTANLPRWADAFPYVNGGLFGGNTEVPRISRIAQKYLIHIGQLDWKQINPDIFGSMIQAVADDEERSALGMHYTSVPNILKVLNPLFLDDLNAALAEAGDSPRKLLNLRKRMSNIRVFDPACGSGNFLVIAYKQMREIEATINARRGEADIETAIPLTNFRGIELRDFSAEIARLALIIAEYQCDVIYRGPKVARDAFLPLDARNWITCGNALRLDWLSICPPTGTGVKMASDDLFGTPLDQVEIDFENEGGETYICGNPPYLGSKRQAVDQKEDLERVFASHSSNWKSLDYVAAWLWKAVQYGLSTKTATAFVATNSVCQGQQAAILWPLIYSAGADIFFAHKSFNWSNLAAHNAGVTVIIVGVSNSQTTSRRIFEIDGAKNDTVREVMAINAYLVPGKKILVNGSRKQIAGLPDFDRGNSPTDGGHLLMTSQELAALKLSPKQIHEFIRPFVGSQELIRGMRRFCIWVDDDAQSIASDIPQFRDRFERVRAFRHQSEKAATRKAANWPYRFDERKPLPNFPVLCVPITSSESREFLPADLLPAQTVVSNLAFAMPCESLWVFGLVVSKTMLSWVATVCARMRTDYRFTNTLCWNTFPVPKLTEKNKSDLTRCAQDILLAREAHFPATIADLYDPEKMPENLRAAHDRNDEVLERIYIGRRFKNDTERLEKLFDMYTQMTTKVPT